MLRASAGKALYPYTYTLYPYKPYIPYIPYILIPYTLLYPFIPIPSSPPALTSFRFPLSPFTFISLLIALKNKHFKLKLTHFTKWQENYAWEWWEVA